jgi:hypothetical protein
MQDDYDSEDDYDVKDDIVYNVVIQSPKTKKEVVAHLLEEVRRRKIIMGRYTMAYLIETICNKLKIPVEL